ncbi:MAG: DUF6125 family protein [Planctomycetota bacterium]
MSQPTEPNPAAPDPAEPEDGEEQRRREVAARMIVTLDGLWFRSVLEALGPEKTLAMDIQVFQRQFKIATRVIRERFGLDGESRADKARVFEEMARLYGHRFEVFDDGGSVTMRLHRCGFLQALRAAGVTDHDCRVVCRALQPAWFGEMEPRTNGKGELRLGLPDDSGPCDWSIEQPE